MTEHAYWQELYAGNEREVQASTQLNAPIQTDCDWQGILTASILYNSDSQPPGRGPVPGPGINYTGPREVHLEFVISVF